MEQGLKEIERRSSILTNHMLKVSHSLPTLPLIKSQNQSHHPSKKIIPFSIKTKQQLINEERYRDLTRLKIILNKLHIQNSQFKIKQYEKPPAQDDYVKNIESQLDNVINPQKRIFFVQSQPTQMHQHNTDLDKIQFIQNCMKLCKVSHLILKEGNMHFKNKMIAVISNTKSKERLRNLFLSLLQPDINLDRLYQKYRKQYKKNDGILRKELKIISLQSGYIINNYQKNRYRYLNQDINRIKLEMCKDGRSIGDKLNQVQNRKIRNGIYCSLKNMEFDCLANRNFYSELTGRLEQIMH